MEQWMTLAEVAQYLQISRDAVYRMAQRDKVPASKIARQWRFDRQEIDAWMRSERCRPVVAQPPLSSWEDVE